MFRRSMAKAIKAATKYIYNAGIVYREPRATRWNEYQAYNDGSRGL